MKTVQQIMEETNAKANMEAFMEMQKWPYRQKVRHAKQVARTFWEDARQRGYNCHVSVGGLDSIVLHYFLESIGISVPVITCSSLEGKGVQAVHRQIAQEMSDRYTYWSDDTEGLKPEVHFLKPLKSKVQVLQECGWPVLSKEIAGKIALLQNPTPENATVRHAIITGETGEYGGWQKDSRMQLSRRWLEKFGGADAEGAALGYAAAKFKVSDRCCYWLKEKPCDDWAREHHSVPYLGLMASEGGRREKSLKMHGCNYWGKSTIRSAPFAIFDRQDLLQLALDLAVPVPVEYGEIVCDPDGTLRTTLAQRTGCTMCGFGITLERRPHRFDLLREKDPREWEFWMYNVATDENGERYGWGRILDYVGVEWENAPGQVLGQVSMEELYATAQESD